MKYEIDFLPVGNGDTSGDAIALRYCEDDSDDYKIMVIDGGTKESGEKLVGHINKYYQTKRVDYVVNTHPDQDHASGLSIVMEKLTVGELWLHRPWQHAEKIIDHFKDQRITVDSLKERLKTNYSHAYELEKIATEKDITIKEPFQGEKIGDFTVMSPYKNWYLHTLIPDSNKTPDTTEGTSHSAFSKIKEIVLNVFENLFTETLKEGGQTSPENESSVILHAEFNDEGIMLTGDAGIQALNKAADFHGSISNKLRFIQVPHHGSRRNVSPSILDRLLGQKAQEKDNKTAFISAGKESTKHPRKIVVNAFIRRGCKVCSTKGNTICYSHNTPSRDGWSATTPLDLSTEVEAYDE